MTERNTATSGPTPHFHKYHPHLAVTGETLHHAHHLGYGQPHTSGPLPVTDHETPDDHTHEHCPTLNDA